MSNVYYPVLYFQNQVDVWQELLDQESDADNRAVFAEFRDEAATLADQFQRIFYAYQDQGIGLTLKSESNFCVVLPDATEPGRFRYQTFDVTGFIGHVTRNTVEEVLLDAVRSGFREIDTSDILDKFSKTREWAKGSAVNDLVRKVNCGDLTYDEANRQYEEAIARIYAGGHSAFVLLQ
jgi:hypothetical protein